jgi:hypothetical protein
MRFVLPLLLLVGCYADARLGASSPVGPGHGGVGPDFSVGFGAAHRGGQVRAGGGLTVGTQGDDDHHYIPIGAEARIDVGITEPNDVGGRLVAVGQAAVGVAYRPEAPDEAMTSDGTFARVFVGVGIGATRSPTTERKVIRAGSAAIGVLASRTFITDGDDYWQLGVALSLSFGLDIPTMFERCGALCGQH